MNIAQQSLKSGCLVTCGHCLSTAAAIKSGTLPKCRPAKWTTSNSYSLFVYNRTVLIKLVLHKIQFLTQREHAQVYVWAYVRVDLQAYVRPYTAPFFFLFFFFTCTVYCVMHVRQKGYMQIVTRERSGQISIITLTLMDALPFNSCEHTPNLM